MNDETPWSHLQRLFAERKRFEDALPGLQAHGLSGEDIGVLMNNPDSELYRWMRLGAGDAAVALEPVEPPEGAGLPPRRTGKRGLMGWLSGAPAVEGLGLFTGSDSFALQGVDFAVLPEPLRPVGFGELVSVHVLALNCTSVARQLTVELEAEPGLVQSPCRYVLSLEPGVISMAVLPVRICPWTPAVVRVVPVFHADDAPSERPWRFSARPYARPANELVDLLAGATLIAAATGLSPVYLRSNGPANQGSPDPVRLKVDLSRPVVAPQQSPVLWRLLSLPRP